MIRLALSSLRFRTAAFLAIFVAVLLGSALMSAAGGLLETGLRLNASPQRLADAPIIVTGRPAYHPPNGSGSVAYPERHGVDPALVAELAATEGVAKAIPDVSFPAVVAPGHEALAGHGWTSAELTPYKLTAGTAPAAGQVVLDNRLAGGAKPGDKVNVIVSGVQREFVLAGVASPQNEVDVPSVFFAAADTLSGSTRSESSQPPVLRPPTSPSDSSCPRASPLWSVTIAARPSSPGSRRVCR